jgi:hypothetical protein
MSPRNGMHATAAPLASPRHALLGTVRSLTKSWAQGATSALPMLAVIRSVNAPSAKTPVADNAFDLCRSAHDYVEATIAKRRLRLHTFA